MKIYHTETQEDYDALMVELEEQGCKWLSGDGMTELNKNWKRHSSETCVRVDKEVVVYDKKELLQRRISRHTNHKIQSKGGRENEIYER